MRALVTGGAGFIGSHLVDGLVERGHEVVVLDSLEEGVHGGKRPGYLNPRATYVWGDLRDRGAVAEAMEGVEAVFHLAALIEVAASMEDLGRYVDVNVRGTAVLLDEAKHRPDVRRLVLASSAAVYGEGRYACPDHGVVPPRPRTEGHLQRGEWEVRCSACGQSLDPQPTPEEKDPAPISNYGLTKLLQERLFEAASAASGVPAALLRFANVYGPRQRGGPYAGVATLFARRLREGEPPVVHEDGRQRRDFIHVRDVVRALLATLDAEWEGALVANVGAGEPVTVLRLAEVLGELTGTDLPPKVEGTYRPGDIRHLWFDLTRARDRLGFEASVPLKEGLRELLRTL